MVEENCSKLRIYFYLNYSKGNSFPSFKLPVAFYIIIFMHLYVPSAMAVVPQKLLGPALPDNETIASFTKIINSGRLDGIDLARRYWERGIQYGKLAQYNKSIADYGSAISLQPNYIAAYIERAKSYARLENYSAAFADLNRSLDIDSNNGSAYTTRAALNFLLGRYQQAAADYERYLNLYPQDMYRMLWLFLSEEYYRKNSATKVKNYVGGVNLDQWPGAILKLYLGEVDAKTLMNALSKGVSGMNAGHKCEAYYYLAQYFLLNNDRARAKELFNKAVATNAKSYIEYEFAVAYSLKIND